MDLDTSWWINPVTRIKIGVTYLQLLQLVDKVIALSKTHDKSVRAMDELKQTLWLRFENVLKTPKDVQWIINTLFLSTALVRESPRPLPLTSEQEFLPPPLRPYCNYLGHHWRQTKQKTPVGSRNSNAFFFYFSYIYTNLPLGISQTVYWAQTMRRWRKEKIVSSFRFSGWYSIFISYCVSSVLLLLYTDTSRFLRTWPHEDYFNAECNWRDKCMWLRQYMLCSRWRNLCL